MEVGLLPIAEFVINNGDAASTRVSFFSLSHGYDAKILDTDEKELGPIGKSSLIQKADGIITKFKQASDWAQTAMAVAQQEQ